MRDFKELDGCYILNIMFAIGKVDKIPLSEFYDKGYWITDWFGDKCYLVKPHQQQCIFRFTCKLCFCELTEEGKKFIKEYAENKTKKYAKYLQGGYNEKYDI